VRVGPTLEKVLDTYGDKVALVFKQLPLPMHSQAKAAAIAMLAAGRQGKAWEMHDAMFDNSRKLSRDDLRRYAGDLGLDVEKFTRDLDDPEIAKQVDSDVEEAKKVGATGTPTIFVNGTRIRGARPFADFKKIIDAELVAADKALAEGTKAAELYETLAKAKVKSGVKR
jgi:protein-disulfide isomerase